jgi:hypothetical protein
MRALLAAAAPRALMLNATAAGLPLYAALGFAAAGEVHQYQGSWRGRAPCHAGLRPATAADLPALAALDAAAFGAPRPRSLSAALAGGTAVMREDGAGFAIARRFGRGFVIGPVVAPDEPAAIALVEALARPGAFLRLDIPAAAAALAGALSAQGLAKVDIVVAMTRGAWRAAGTPRRFALIAQALG